MDIAETEDEEDVLWIQCDINSAQLGTMCSVLTSIPKIWTQSLGCALNITFCRCLVELMPVPCKKICVLYLEHAIIILFRVFSVVDRKKNFFVNSYNHVR